MRYDADSKEEAQCPVCRKKFLNKVYMLAHYKKDHSKNGKKFACVKCNFKAPYNEQVMTAHLRMHELADASKKSYKSAVNSEKEIFHECDQCDLKFRSIDYLKLHMEAKHYATMLRKKEEEAISLEEGEVSMDMMDETWSVLDAVPMISESQRNKVNAPEMNFLTSFGSRS